MAVRRRLLVRQPALKDKGLVEAIDVDPLLLSRELQRANDLFESWQATLSAEEAVVLSLPVSRELLGHERVAGVLARPEQDPLRQPLLRWLHLLTERRVNQTFYARVADLRTRTDFPVSEPRKGTFSLRNMLHEALRAEPERPFWLARIAENAAVVSEAESLHWQRKAELARRLKLNLDALVFPCADVLSLAEEWLRRSRDLAREFPTPDLARYLVTVLGREAHEGLPSRLNTHTLADWFRDGTLLQGLDPEAPTLPEPLGASSFARALWSFGSALRVAQAPEHQPFVIAHDPYGLEAHGWGALFASLLTQPSFVARKLGLASAKAKDFCRVTARLWLFELRWLAFKVVLRPLALGSQKQLLERFPESCHQHLGFDLAKQLSLVLPRLSDDDAQRFVALATVAPRLRELEESHNDDWFRNPRAIDQLRSEAKLSPQTTSEADSVRSGLEAGFQRLSKMLGS